MPYGNCICEVPGCVGPCVTRAKQSGDDMDLPDAFVREIVEDLRSMSGLVLWHVTGTWANSGRAGTIDCVIEAMSAPEAIALAWGPEDDRDLRIINVKWLCPIESVHRADLTQKAEEE